MDVQELRAALSAIGGPAVVVATAGTTDFGSIDPVEACVAAARDHGAWLHIDAAYGGVALLSRRLAPLLAGACLADSISLDFHKLGWQPVASGMLLVRRKTSLEPLERRVAYLNSEDEEEAGYPNTLGRSIRTTRRADAFKLAVTLRALGRAGIEQLVDSCHALANIAAEMIVSHPRLELEARPVLTSVVFRYKPDTADETDSVNAAIRLALMRQGSALVGRTDVPPGPNGRVRLKLTLLNPFATRRDVQALLDAVIEAGDRAAAGDRAHDLNASAV